MEVGESRERRIDSGQCSSALMEEGRRAWRNRGGALAGGESRGGEMAARRGGRGKRQRGLEWGQKGSEKPSGAPDGGANGRWAGNPAAKIRRRHCQVSTPAGGRRR